MNVKPLNPCISRTGQPSRFYHINGESLQVARFLVSADNPRNKPIHLVVVKGPTLPPSIIVDAQSRGKKLPSDGVNSRKQLIWLHGEYFEDSPSVVKRRTGTDAMAGIPLQTAQQGAITKTAPAKGKMTSKSSRAKDPGPSGSKRGLQCTEGTEADGYTDDHLDIQRDRPPTKKPDRLFQRHLLERLRQNCPYIPSA